MCSQCVVAVNGAWSDWMPWSSCSASCGTDGQETRSRLCNNPAPSNGGEQCEGDSSEDRQCQQQPPACPGTSLLILLMERSYFKCTTSFLVIKLFLSSFPSGMHTRCACGIFCPDFSVMHAAAVSAMDA